MRTPSSGPRHKRAITLPPAPLPDLVALFDALPRPEAPQGSGSSDVFAVALVPGGSGHRVGCDTSGAPCVLLDVRRPAPGKAAPLGVTLAHLTIQHDVRCELLGAGAPEIRRMSIVRFIGPDRELREQFLRVMAPIICQVGNDPAPEEVTGALRKLIDLFRALERPARKSVQGLWAELLLITRASDALLAVSSWHAAPGDRYDFMAGSERVEVKSAGRGARAHHFSAEQLSPPASTSVLIASVLVEAVGGGTSLGELLQEARDRVASQPDLMLRVDAVSFATLGEQLPQGLEMRFDLELATESFAWFRSAQVPSVTLPLPAGVSEVRFKSDLTGIVPMTYDEVRATGRLGTALAPGDVR